MEKYDRIIFDFDDTIWSRNSNDIDCSIYNAKFIKNNLDDKSIIISGNSYTSIDDKLSSLGIKFKEVWADANSTLYKYGENFGVLSDLVINKSNIDIILKSISNLTSNIKPQVIGKSNIKLRPIESDDFRNFLVDELNYSIFPNLNIKDCIAKKTGKTTVDILSIYNSKTAVYYYNNLNEYKTLYIGDEIDSGNDRDIANLCTRKLKVSSVYETKAILDCFGGKL